MKFAKPLFIIFASALFIGTLQGSQREIKIAGDVWCPFTCESQEKPGILVELTKIALEKKGYRVKYEVVNWTRAVVEARNGSYDAIVGASEGDAPDFFFPSKPMAASQFCLYTNPDSTWQYTGPKSLEKIKLGWAQDYSAGPELDDYVAQNKKNKARIDFVSGDNLLLKNIKKLEAKRIDAFSEDKYVFAYFTANEKISTKLRNAGCIPETQNSVAFSPKNPGNKALTEELSQDVEKFKKTPAYKELLKKYNL